MKKNLFVAIEGIDGCGKDTQIDMIVDSLPDFVSCRNISKYPLGIGIRGMISSTDNKVDKFMHNNVGVAYMYLSELFFVQEEIKELLETNDVICSRWHYSTMAYVGDSSVVKNVIKTAASELLIPDIVIRLKLDLDTCLNRISNRGDTIEFFEKENKLKVIDQRYDNIDQMYSPMKVNVITIDVNGKDRETIHETIKSIILNYKTQL